MARFLLLSAILHVVVFSLLFMKSKTVIEDPVVAVSFDLNRAPTPQISKGPRPQISGKKIDMSSAPVAESTAEASEPSSAGPYESGNVSVKPKVKKSVQVTYPAQAKEARVEGAVKLSVIIDEEGHVQKVSVLEGPGYGLNEAAEQALQQFIFSPAEVQGKKVPVQIVYVYRFRLESR